MPTITRYRTWCPLCQDWTLHRNDNIETNAFYHCTKCDNSSESYILSDVPEHKIAEQRKRYRSMRTEQFLQTVLLRHGVEESVHVIEDDAGQRKIDEKRQLERQIQKAKLQELKDESKKYSNVGRNEKCLCGSGKKYKQCHLLHFRKLGF